MINDNQKYFDRMHVLIDALVLALSYVLSWYCYVRLGVMNNHPERGILPPATYMMALLYIVPGYLLLYYASEGPPQPAIRFRRCSPAFSAGTGSRPAAGSAGKGCS